MKHVFVVSIILFISQINLAQSEHSVNQSSTKDSTTTDAISVIQECITMMDQKKLVSTFKSIDVAWIGTRNWGSTLSPSVSGPHALTPVENRVAMDFVNDKAFSESKWQYHGYEIQRFLRFYQKDRRYWTFSQGFGEGEYGEEDKSFGNDFSSIANKYFLPTFLTNMINNESIQLSIDDSLLYESHGFNIVKLERDNAPPTHLFFDKLSSLLHRIERPHQDPLYGTVILREYFYNYSLINNLILPTSRTQTVANRIVIEQKASYRFNNSLPQEFFSLPEEYFQSQMNLNFKPSIEKIADAIYLVRIRHNQNIVLIEFEDYYIAVHAPWNSSTVEAGLKLASKLLSKKRIKYIGLTNHHWDASGGVRAFISREIPIITTAKNIQYLEKMASAKFTITPDNQSSENRKPEFKIIKERETITDGRRKLVLLPVYGSQNIDESIYFYLPKERVLISCGGFEAGFYSGKENSISASNSTLHMVETVKIMGLDIEMVITVNGGKASWDEVLSSVRKRLGG